ncbi:Glyoxylase, beta-lactamase superfamily II [Amycolatopsis xylanica]|uniref:Glyoxylase, beta-lactamase superfamily II n=1 Tax=Amycolatopsis xylanica TaxID=589385 RepID=A0A1H2YAZ7_9PSEU|nr:MBL fold metallo-hydrolase [Amycolatopsis xylanica]SDX02008.1 Glyoxylase, beta-lactamase superfamily II [Amycolatopsis xylanica]
MKVHHLNCGTMRPLGGRLPEMVAHCLLVEAADGLVLIDSGFGSRALEEPGKWLGTALTKVVGARLERSETAAAQVAALGYAVEDVRHIVTTHLDCDHAGGLADFPHATVHVHAEEHRAATAPANLRERYRYRSIQFEHGPKWSTYRTDGESWFGFEAVRELKGLPPEILLIPLGGHTLGHVGVAVDTGSGWLLHAGDAYFHHGQVDPVARHCPGALEGFQKLVQTQKKPRLANERRLRELVRHHGDEVRVFSAHDHAEFAAFTAS